MTWIELGEEVHDDRDQFFQVEKGEVVTDVRRSTIKGDDAIIISAGARRNIMNTGEVLAAMHRLCRPEHRDGTVHVARADAKVSEEHFDGKTTE